MRDGTLRRRCCSTWRRGGSGFIRRKESRSNRKGRLQIANCKLQRLMNNSSGATVQMSFVRIRAAAIAAIVFAVTQASGLKAQASQGWPKSRAEATNYTVTSSHADIIAFLDSLQQKAGDRIWVGSIGKTTQGRELVYAIA